MEKALSHIRVIDLTHFIAGPYCTKFLAGFGAQVIKVEPPKTGDKLRSVGPFFRNRESVETSIPFLWLNTGKKGVTLDLKTEKGVGVLKALVRQADVLVENFSPQVMPGLGLSYETLREINPRLIMASISNFGQSGPYRDFKAEEIQIQAMSGMMHLSGDANGPPLAAGPAVCQYVAGLHAYLAISMALYRRGSDGTGVHADISILESALENVETQLASHLHLGTNPKRGSHLGVPWDLYPCEDGYAAIISMPARHWHRAAEILEDPELFDRRYEHILGRVKDRHNYEDRLKHCLKTHKKITLFHAGQSRHLAFGYLASLEEVLASPQHKERGFFVELDHPATGKQRYCDAPFKMSESPWQSFRAPLLGEHNRLVYGDMLGYSIDELGLLEKEGVI
jgi:CoA:oxalate CoA-transferase